MSDKNAQVDADVRDALLDIASAQKQVEVAQSSVDLANEALNEAQQRYANGVSDNLAVSQAQQSVAQANNQYVASLYRHNVAKLSLARALGAGRELQELSGREVNVADRNTNPTRRHADPKSQAAQPRPGRRLIVVRRMVVLIAVAVGNLVALHLQRRHRRCAGQRPSDPGQRAHRRPGHQGRCRREPAGEGGRRDRRTRPRDYQVAVENAEAALASARPTLPRPASTCPSPPSTPAATCAPPAPM